MARNGRIVKVIELEGVTNVRDFGGAKVSGGRAVATGLFFRGGSLNQATERDVDVLSRILKIACIIDVRCGWERAEKRAPVVPGAVNLHIPFYDKDIVGIEYLEPAAGTKVVGRDVACDPVRFYRSLSNPLTTKQIEKAVRTAFSYACRGQAVYLHCSGGKDRTGVLAAIVLAVLGASPDDIMADYVYTNVSRDKNYEREFQRFLRFADGDAKRARELTLGHRANPENLESFVSGVKARFGAFDAYLSEALGITPELRALYRERCTAPSPMRAVAVPAASFRASSAAPALAIAR